MGWPLIGSALNIDPGRPWLSFIPWAKQYGPAVLVWTFGQPVLVLNTMDMANALLVKKSAIYCASRSPQSAFRSQGAADRPRLVMADEIITEKMNPTLARTEYGTHVSQPLRFAVDRP
jgi:hypothetical protein